MTSKARDCVIENKFSQALHYLQRAYIIPGFRYISADAPFEMNLLASQIEIGLINGPNALLAAETAKEQICREEKTLSKPDRTYLLSYCDSIIDYCVYWRAGLEAPTDRVKNVVKFGVSRHYLSNYPLPKEGYFV